MRAFVEQADQQKQQAGDQAVRDHLRQRAAEAGGVERGDAEQHDAHVRDRGVGDHRFQVGLPPGQNGTVKQADQGQQRQPVLQRLHRRRQGRGGANQAVGAHLQQNPREQDGNRTRRLDVGERQPAMQRHDRHLDAEAQQQAEKDQDLRAYRQLRAAGGHVGHRKGVPGGDIVEQQQGNQHEHRAAERIQDEIERCAMTIGAPQTVDQEEQGISVNSQQT
jgi:hypothetical protein